MFKTIQSKVLINVLLTLSLQIAVIFCFNFIVYQKVKNMILDSFSRFTSIEAQKINKEVMSIEDNALDLAVFGEVYHKTKQNREFLEKFVIKVFENYEESLGGGIWFEPYKINPNKKFHNIYAFRNKDNQVVIDRQFESEEYNYFNQKWYKEIIKQLKSGKKTAWSSPYYEKEGSNSLMVTAGSGIYNHGELIGISTVDWELNTILKSIMKIKPTPNSFALFADRKNDFVIVSTEKNVDNDKITGTSVTSVPWYNDNLRYLTYFDYQNTKYIPYVKQLDNGMMLVINIPKWELFRILAIDEIGGVIILIIFCLFIFGFLYKLMKEDIINPIDKLEEAANKISNGKSDINIVIEKPAEFAHLASTFTKMANDIKNITYKQTKLESELIIAKSIQKSSLPHTFPPFPDRKEFNIYATMTPAKEVGGDFFDFYFIDNKNFMFLIADVSGKGIPAALFMMTTKTLIANMAQRNLSPKDMIEEINKRICKNNQEIFFVTMFACIINLETGEMSCINCGHNPPLLYRSGSCYEYLKIPQNIVLGIFPNAKYEIFETKLNKGDKIFLYTDGITEAVNSQNILYGEKNLLNSINNWVEDDIMKVADKIKSEVDKYSAGMEQSDDITMLLFEYSGNKKSYKNKAEITNYKDFYGWLNSIFDEWKIDGGLKNKIEICVEEVFTNICFYAYPEQKGMVEVNIVKDNDEIEFEFIDEGKPYNPLEKPDPDINLPAEQRQIGGLGIYMVKQMTQKTEYKYFNEKNIFKIFFKNDV